MALREVDSPETGRYAINCGAERPFSAGIYFVRLSQRAQVATARVTGPIG